MASPGVRLALHVHDGDNEKGAVFSVVNHGKGKTLGAAAMARGGKFRPRLGVADYAFDRTLYFSGELISEAFALGIVIVDGVLKLRFSRWEKPDSR